jgi:hypothetical protein
LVNLGIAFVGDNEAAAVVEEGHAVLNEPNDSPETEGLRSEVVNHGVLFADDGLAGRPESTFEPADGSLGGSIVGPSLGFGVQGLVLRLVFVVGC